MSNLAIYVNILVHVPYEKLIKNMNFASASAIQKAEEFSQKVQPKNRTLNCQNMKNTSCPKTKLKGLQGLFTTLRS